jgi:hypothetical protein
MISVSRTGSEHTCFAKMNDQPSKSRIASIRAEEEIRTFLHVRGLVRGGHGLMAPEKMGCRRSTG